MTSGPLGCSYFSVGGGGEGEGEEKGRGGHHILKRFCKEVFSEVMGPNESARLCQRQEL